MTVSALPETARADSEFDLDVRLQPVARHVSDEKGQRATEITCTQCTTKEFTCQCK
jgi:hypothetical protein